MYITYRSAYTTIYSSYTQQRRHHGQDVPLAALTATRPAAPARRPARLRGAVLLETSLCEGCLKALSQLRSAEHQLAVTEDPSQQRVRWSSAGLLPDAYRNTQLGSEITQSCKSSCSNKIINFPQWQTNVFPFIINFPPLPSRIISIYSSDSVFFTKATWFLVGI